MKKTIYQEKRALTQRILSIYDDKLKYAASKLVEVMCEQEAYALEENGIVEKVDEMNLFDVVPVLEEIILKDIYSKRFY
ncbi:hypothetical protein [Bacillus sp. S10(2024)]|uniref:hypothetical protein n=1 Tax=Bacillus sp. S10(2024) TaxID=3162886 RepID=UPI003D1AD950